MANQRKSYEMQVLKKGEEKAESFYYETFEEAHRVRKKMEENPHFNHQIRIHIFNLYNNIGVEFQKWKEGEFQKWKEGEFQKWKEGEFQKWKEEVRERIDKIAGNDEDS